MKFLYSDYSASGAGTVFFSNAPCSLSSHTKNAFGSSIFHLLESKPLITRCLSWWKMPFLCLLSSTFIFHLPPSIWQVRFRVYVWYADRCICCPIRLYPLKQFVFLSTFSENGQVFISSRMPGPMSPHTWAGGPAYPGSWARVCGLR